LVKDVRSQRIQQRKTNYSPYVVFLNLSACLIVLTRKRTFSGGSWFFSSCLCEKTHGTMHMVCRCPSRCAFWMCQCHFMFTPLCAGQNRRTTFVRMYKYAFGCQFVRSIVVGRCPLLLYSGLLMRLCGGVFPRENVLRYITEDYNGMGERYRG
jgi:hypothetical protein